MITSLKIALHPSVARYASEVKYVFRTLLRVAGYAHRFAWAGADEEADIYYGPDAKDHAGARIRICASGDFRSCDPGREPQAFYESQTIGFISFDGDANGPQRHTDGSVSIHNDWVRSCYWLLTGGMEAHYARDRWDNLQIQGSFVVRHRLLQRPLVSEYGQFLREVFGAAGKPAAPLPWMAGEKASAFAFSHDVDYPQIIKWVECMRLLRSRGAKAWASIAGVLNGTNHFWKFAEWIEFEKAYGTRPAFYFSTVPGSLLQYASGTPDVFYDVGATAFRDLFKLLRDEGCEIGLHASYNAFRSTGQLSAERRRLQEVSGAPIAGNRHHYWRLNPNAPEETLARHEAAGFSYDSSLGFELFPGWRRGICHPFRVYHPTERRELNILQLPPAWMDDHFDRRLAANRIASPGEHARLLLDAARKTRGVAIVDYHARGMNGDFFPRYGPWLKRFLEQSNQADLRFARPADLAAEFQAYERKLQAFDRDEATASTARALGSASRAVEQRRPPRVAVLTLEGSPYGKTLLAALRERGLAVALVIVVKNTTQRKWKLLRGVARRIGWADAIAYAAEELMRPSGPARRAAARSYAELAERVSHADSVRSLDVPKFLRDSQIDVLLLGQSGIVPREVLAVPAAGTLNAHPGMLPEYRGMDCFCWAIEKSQFEQVGSSLHWVDAGVDTGRIVRRLPYRWRGDETLSDLSARLYDDCIGLLVDAVVDFQAHDLESVENERGTQFYKMPRSTRKQVEGKLRAFLAKGRQASADSTPPSVPSAASHASEVEQVR